MKTQKDIPYGISDFGTLIKKNKYYVDRTGYIEKLENHNSSFIFFLRPRRFGKSLLISMFNYYYGVQYKNEFDSLFGEHYIGKNSTENRNSYYILKFDFSGIDTTLVDQVQTRFNEKILSGLEQFNLQYKLLKASTFSEITKHTVPAVTINDFFIKVQPFLRHKIFVLVDEYDHFTNEILAFKFDAFSDAVSKNGYVRKFYEVIKTFTSERIVDRFFATGVTPVTLDSMTSGFNIATNISLDAEFNEMAGFTKEEVGQMIYDLFPGIEENVAKTILTDAELWYNGSLFSARSKTKLYNPAMLLRFISKIDADTFEYPEKMVDTNILSDYSKIKSLIKIEDYTRNIEIIKSIIENGTYNSKITEIFSFETDFTKQDLISLLYYNGLLTIKEPFPLFLSFEPPNYVIKEVYWEFFASVLSRESEVKTEANDISNAILAMAYQNDIQPIVEIVTTILKALSNRDFRKFDEKYIKMLYIVYISITKSYFIKSEPEVNLNYPDLMFFEKKTFRPKYQQLFELKYIKKSESDTLETVKSLAIEQVQRYMQLEELKTIPNLKYWVIIYTGNDCTVCEEVKNNG